jgi:hypothetical protein
MTIRSATPHNNINCWQPLRIYHQQDALCSRMATLASAQAFAHLVHLHLSPQPQLPSEHLQALELHMLQPVACTLLASPPAQEPQKQSSLQSQLEPQLHDPPFSHLHTMVATLWHSYWQRA